MKVKYVNDNITIKELSENHWNDCKYHTLKFINGAKINEEYEAKKGYNEDYFIVFIDNEEYLVNSKLFEIIEEPKKIENITWKEKESLAGIETQKTKIEILSRRTEKLKKSLNEIIDYINSKENNNE